MVTAELTLWYGSVLVGLVNNAFCSEGTWHGNIESLADTDQTVITKRLAAFVEFCKDWNERQHDPNPPDAGEFDHFSDLLDSGLWVVKNAAGEETRIVRAPVFFVGGDVSWLTE